MNTHIYLDILLRQNANIHLVQGNFYCISRRLASAPARNGSKIIYFPRLLTRTIIPEFVSVELDLWGYLIVVPGLLHVKALVDVVLLAVLAVHREPVEAVVGVLDVHDAGVVVVIFVSLKDGAVRLALDRDVCIRPPVFATTDWQGFESVLATIGCQRF